MQQNQNMSGDSLGRLTYATSNRGDSGDTRNEFQLGIKRDFDDAGFDQPDMGMSSDDDGSDRQESRPKKTPPANGKKTKGRVKIKMEFIDNKLRRYTTFSKRKTGIMKKAYELSTLTGTQVMLLVASETGHVYTFATRKLQPMITSETGKSLIQTCLNSPDPMLNSGHHVDQRMSATGFEETEFTYSINDEDQKVDMQKAQAMYLSSTQMESSPSPQSPGMMGSQGSSSSPKPNNITMQLPPGTGFATILTQSGGQTVQLTSMPQNQDGNGGSQQQLQQQQHQQQTLYKLSQSLPPHSSSAGSTDTHGTVTMVHSSHGQTLPVVSGGLVYQSAPGVVYASASGQLGDQVIFNFNQNNSMQLPQESGGGTQSQQYITIPIALTATPQLVHTPGSNTGSSQSHNSHEGNRSSSSSSSKNVGRK